MKVIDLYNRIADDKPIPNKIKIKNFDNIFTLREDCTGYKWYGEEKTHNDFGETIYQNLEFILKQEFEIIEDYEEPQEELKEIEKLSYQQIGNQYDHKTTVLDINKQITKLGKKINEIVEFQNEVIRKIREMENKNEE